MTEDEEKELRLELLSMDVQLRRKQVGWETPRNIAILAASVAALAAAIGGFFGFKLAQYNPQPPIIIQMPAQK